MPHPANFLSTDQAARARVLFINYPHNPTGQLADQAYLQSLVDWARDRGCIIVSDMAYGEIYFEPARKPASVLACNGALDCAIEMHSFSKRFHMPGWRVGFAVGNETLIGGLHRVKSNIDSGCFDAIQLALARTLDDPRCDPFLDENRAHYKARLDKVCSALDDMGIRYHRPGASIFIWCELPDNAPLLLTDDSGQPHPQAGLKDSLHWCAELLDSTGLVVGPGRGYGEWGEGFFRLSLSTPDEDIDRALSKLRSFVNH